MTSRRLNPVAWMEGMFLQPHHLQHHEQFSEARLQYHLRSLNPFHYGIREFALDEEALSDNRIEVLRLDAVLPGGTILHYPGNSVVESREFDPTLERVPVYAAIRNMSPIDPNSATDGDGVRDVRYVVRPSEIPDVHRGGFEASVDLVHPNVRILISGDESELELHESIKVAEIRATGESKRPFALAEDYCPPLLALQAFPPIHEEVAKIASQIAAKVRVVAGRTTSFAIGDLPRLWMRYTLSRMAAVLRHLLSTGFTHPFDMYTTLVEIAGSLSAFSRAEPAELPLYDHDDLNYCFHQLIEFIDHELGAAVPDRFREFAMPFETGKKYYWTEELSVQLVDPRNLYYIGIKADMDSKALAEFVGEHGKASSPTGITPLLMLARPGLRLEHLPAPPTEIAARTGFEYFKVDPHGPQWSKVREEYAFALNLEKLEHAEVRLYVVTGES